MKIRNVVHRMKNPPHPGGFVKHEVIEALNKLACL